MNTEIERKFVPVETPATDVLGAGQAMRQGYLAEEGDVVVRLRITDAGAVLTVKAGHGLRRTEVEVPLDPEQAEALWAHTEGRRIEKVRHKVPVDGGVAEVDLYGGPLAGLCTIEVEFDSEEAAGAFVVPDWFGRDVTGDGRWVNAALARHGVPT
jgi:adenylate cyclase